MSDNNCPKCFGSGIMDEGWMPCDCGATRGEIVRGAGKAPVIANEAPARGNGCGKGHGAGRKVATVKQVAYLNSLIEARDPANEVIIAAKLVVDYNMAMSVASTWIDTLRSIPPMPVAGAVRANKFSGKCGHCGKFVAEGAGRIEKIVAKWVTFHLDGQCPTVEAPVAIAADEIDLAPLKAFTTRGMVRFGVPQGETRLKLMVKFSNDGRVWVTDAAVYGERTTYGCQRPGQGYKGKCADALRAILADPMAALRAYAALTSECGMCGRPLEDEDSVARGIGPICAGKL